MYTVNGDGGDSNNHSDAENIIPGVRTNVGEDFEDARYSGAEMGEVSKNPNSQHNFWEVGDERYGIREPISTASDS